MEQGTSTVYCRRPGAGQGTGRDPAPLARPHRPRLGRRAVLPVAPVPRGRRACGIRRWSRTPGSDSRVFGEVTATGAAVGRLAESWRGRPCTAHVAVLHDSDAWWAVELGRPALLRSRLPLGTLRRTPIGRCGTPAWSPGFRPHPEDDLSRYRLVLAPALYLLSDAGADNLRRYVEGGGTLLVQHFSGVVDSRPACPPRRLPGRATACGAGYPGRGVPAAAARRADHPLRRLARHGLERVRAPDGAETVATYTHGMLAGSPRRSPGTASARLTAGTCPPASTTADYTALVLAAAGGGRRRPGAAGTAALRRSRDAPGARTAAAGTS